MNAYFSIICSLYFLGLATINLFRLRRQSQTGKWPKAEGVVVQARKDFQSYVYSSGYVGSDGGPSEHVTERLNLLYRYVVNGREFFGGSIAPGIGNYIVSEYNKWGMPQSQILQFAAMLVEGDKVEVFYNPQKPQVSYLVGGIQRTTLFSFIGMTIVAILFLIPLLFYPLM